MKDLLLKAATLASAASAVTHGYAEMYTQAQPLYQIAGLWLLHFATALVFLNIMEDSE